jgi:hypothetical protein
MSYPYPGVARRLPAVPETVPRKLLIAKTTILQWFGRRLALSLDKQAPQKQAKSGPQKFRPMIEISDV